MDKPCRRRSAIDRSKETQEENRMSTGPGHPEPDAGPASPPTDAKETQEEVAEHRRLRAPVLYEVIRQEGLVELERPVTSLWWSGVAAGLAISTSVYCEAFIRSHLPDTDWRPLIENFGYCVGFLIVILGGFQLFTEQTVTAVLPVLHEPTVKRFVLTARLWSIVFLANMTGTFVAALLGLVVGWVHPENLEAALDVARHLTDNHALKILLLGMPAGFFMAALVWILASCEGNEFWVITLLTYMIALGDLTHVVAGSAEVFLLMLIGEQSILNGLFGVILPALAGNIAGGTILFTLIAYAQVKDEL
jgi:formate/nitrite transporter FocA (FNT family)